MEGFWILDKTNHVKTSLWAQRASDQTKLGKGEYIINYLYLFNHLNYL